MKDEEVLRAQLLAWTNLSTEKREEALRLYADTTKSHRIVRYNRRVELRSRAISPVGPGSRA